MAENVKLWPDILRRVEKEWNDGYSVEALRVSERTQTRLALEGGGRVRKEAGIVYANTEFGRILLKVDPNMPDDLAILQVRAKSPAYRGPVALEVERISA